MTNITARTYYSKTIGFVLLFTYFSNNSLADVVLDGTMGTTGTLSGNSIEITSDMGATSGNNLFHSFQTFDLTSSQTANFSGPTSVQNIIGRVTGGPSSIDGTISSSISGANLYLLNPNGILFGANATINISGSFHATTADSLRFTDNLVFYADPSQDPILSSASPAAFGFLTDTPASITVDGSQLNASSGNTLSLIGGDLDISNNASLTTEDGQINLVSVKSRGDVDFTNNEIQMNNFQDLGDISVKNNSLVSSSGNGGGRIVIRGGTLAIDSSSIDANTTGTGTTDLKAGIDIALNQNLTLDHDAHISTNAEMLTSGDSNGITIDAGNISVDNQSSIESIGLNDDWFESPSTGNSGNINIDAADISIANLSYITTHISGIGNAGDITIIANNIDINGPLDNSDPANFDERTFTGIDASVDLDADAQSGNIEITANDLKISNAARISTNVYLDQDAGNIQISVNDLEVLSGARIQSTSASGGQAGNITIIAENHVTVSGVYRKPSLYSFLPSAVEESQIVTNSGGERGNIDITANTLEVLDGGKISAHKASGIGDNDAGNIFINTNTLIISGVNQALYENSILNDHLPEIAYLQAVSSINADARGFSNDLPVGSNPDNSGANKNAGNIDINTDSLIISEGGQLSTQLVGIESDIETLSRAGQININAADINIASGGRITSGSKDSGNAGSISIQSSNFTIDGTTATGTLTEDQFTGLVSSANTDQEANAGDITITSNQLNMNGNANIVSESTGLGSGGDISINTNDLVLQKNSKISSNASNAGTAGNIGIIAGNNLSLINSSITTQAVISDGGNINIKADNFIQLNASTLSTLVASETGNGGNIDLESQSVVLDSANIVASAIGGNGGNINIKSSQIFVTPNSTIEATSESAIDGEINIQNLPESSVNLTAISTDTVTPILLTSSECNDSNLGSSSLNITNIKLASWDVMNTIQGNHFNSSKSVNSQVSTKKLGTNIDSTDNSITQKLLATHSECARKMM